MQLKVVGVGEEFHPGVGISGWLGKSDGGKLVFGTDCFDLLGSIMEFGEDFGGVDIASAGGLKQLLVNEGLLFKDILEF